MPTTFSAKKNNSTSTLLSTHTSGSGTIVIQSGDQSKFPATYPFRITVYKSAGTGNLGQFYGTIFNVNSASSNTFNVTVASDESPASVDQTFTVATGQVFNVECDWTYGSAKEYETAINTAESNIATSQSNIIQLQEQATTLYTDTGTANAYVITPAISIGAYSVGQSFTFIPANTNTGASTLNVNGLGAKNILYHGLALNPGNIDPLIPATVVYDGTQFQLLNPSFNSWVSYTPIWNGSIGNGTLTGAYIKAQGVVFYRGKLIPGSTTTFGSGTWTLTTPTNQNLGSSGSNIGSGNILFSNGSSLSTFACVSDALNTFEMWASYGTLSANHPGSWVADSTNQLNFSGFYIPA